MAIKNIHDTEISAPSFTWNGNTIATQAWVNSNVGTPTLDSVTTSGSVTTNNLSVGSLNVTGGTIVSGIDTRTDVGIAIAKGDYLTSNDGNYIRNIIGLNSSGNIEIGQQGTSLISNIQFKPGSNGNIQFLGSGSEDMRIDSSGNVGIGTTSAKSTVHVDGVLTLEGGVRSNPAAGINEAVVIDYQLSGTSLGRLRSRDWDLGVWKDFIIQANDITLDADGILDIQSSAYFSGSTNSGRLYADDWGLKVGTSSGHIQFGPANTSWAHIYTDRPAFYFNKDLYVNNAQVATRSWVTGQGYLTSYTETDTLDSVAGRGATTSQTLTVGGLTTGGTVTSDIISLTNDATDTFRHRVAVYDSGGTSYGMMLWNSNGTSGDWSTMIYGPNQSNRRISFGKLNTASPINHSHVTEIAYFDLDNSHLYLDGRLYPSGSTSTYVDSTRIANWNTAYGWGDHSAAGYLTSFDITTQTDPKYLRSDVDDTASGNLTLQDVNITNGKTLRLYRSGGAAHQRVDARLDGTDQARLHWYGKTDAQTNTGFKHAWYDGANYINVTASNPGVVTFDATTPVIKIDGAQHAGLQIDRGSASYDANLMFLTAGSTKFRVWMDAADALGIRDEANATEMVTFKSGGNVGIGTTSPAQKLHVAGKGLFNNGNLGSTLNDTIYHLEVAGARHHLDFKEVRTAAGSDWTNTTFKLQMRVDSTNHQSIDFVSDSNSLEHIDILTGNQVFNTRFTAGGNVGIGTTSPTRKLQVGTGSADDRIRVYFNDGTYSEQTGYGMEFARNASYLRPNNNNLRTLNIGNSGAAWNGVNVESTNFTWNSNAVATQSWVTSQGYSTSTVYTPDVYEWAGGVFNASGAPIDIAGQMVNGTTTSSQVSPSEIRFTAAGTYMISWSLNWESLYANRSVFGAGAYLNGFIIPGSSNLQYFRYNTYGHASTTNATFSVQVAANDIISWQTILHSGAANHATTPIGGDMGVITIHRIA